MSASGASDQRPLPLFHKIWIAVPALIFLVLAVTLGLSILAMRYAPRQLCKRHREATAVINHVYAHFDRAGQWPSEDEMVEVSQRMPSGWRYSAEHGDDGATLFLHGPFHSFIAYRFTAPGPGPLSKRWRLSEEGDGSDFTAEVAYSPVLR